MIIIDQWNKITRFTDQPIVHDMKPFNLLSPNRTLFPDWTFLDQLYISRSKVTNAVVHVIIAGQ